jgi:agmatinase
MPFIHDLRFTNGHAFRHLAPLPQVLSLSQIGIRSLRNARSWIDDSIRDGNRVVTMREFAGMGPEGIASLVPQGARCYVSIDVDVLDLPLVPGCVSAEPNGMSYADLRDTLAAIAARTEVVGFDFVEVNPQLDVGTGITAYLGAHTVIEFLGRICAQGWWQQKREKWLKERPGR